MGSEGKGGAVVAVGFTEGDIKKDVPAGWKLDKKSGTVSMKIAKDEDKIFVQLASDSKTSFGIKREFKIDIKEYPYINWQWKAGKLPEGGDVRDAGKDDQAIQIYLAFPATGFPEMLNTPVVGYIWDSEAPKEWTGRSSQTGGSKLRYVVVRNKTDKMGKWFTEKRNILDDYKKLFSDIKGGEPTGATRGISLYINSQHTKSDAEGCVCEVFFSKT